MRNKRKGFTLIELLIVVVIVGILALAAIPLVVGNTSRARQAEGRQLLGSARNQLRVAFAEIGSPPATFADADIVATSLQGQYYDVLEAGYTRGTANGTGDLTATPDEAADPIITHNFNWQSGSGTFGVGAAAD